MYCDAYCSSLKKHIQFCSARQQFYEVTKKEVDEMKRTKWVENAKN